MKFLKKLLSGGQAVTISAIEVHDWLEDYSEREMSHIKTQLQKLQDEFDEITNRLPGELEALETAELINPNISPRERHLMIGNRLSYLKKIRDFLAERKTPFGDYAELEEFCHMYLVDLQELESSSAKGFYILREFFEKEVSDIASSMKALEKNVVKIQTLVKSDEVKSLRALFREIKDINQNIIRNNSLEKNVEEMSQEIVEEQEKSAKIKIRLEELKLSKGFTEFNRLDQEKSETNLQLETMKIDLGKRFSNLGKVLRKFKHGTTFENLINDYLSDPMEALKRDTKLEIVRVISKLDLDDFELKASVKKKMRATLDTLNKDFFMDILGQEKKLTQKKSELNSELEKNTVMMNVKEVEYQLEHANRKIEQMSGDVRAMKSEGDSMIIDQKLAHLASQLCELTGEDITIVPQ